MSHYNQNQPPVGVPPPQGHSATVMKKGGLRRKPLLEISNRNQISRKENKRKLTSKKKKSKKLSAVREELFHEEDIVDEIDVHNHEECIKAKHQAMAMEMDYFLKFIGPANDCSKELPSLNMPESPPRSPLRSPLRSPPCSPPSLLEGKWERISRYVAPDLSPPKLPDDDQYWKYWDDRNINLDFTLIDSPKLVKH